eukprot:11346197-Alexandrium_andersonii.AAC.1
MSASLVGSEMCIRDRSTTMSPSATCMPGIPTTVCPCPLPPGTFWNCPPNTVSEFNHRTSKM